MSNENESPQRILKFEVYDATDDVAEAIYLDAYISGRYPHGHSLRLARVRPDASMVPSAGCVLRTGEVDGARTVVVSGEDWMFLGRRWTDGSGRISALARTPDLARSIVTEVAAEARLISIPSDAEVPMGFWHLTGRGPVRDVRTISTNGWEAIRDNYTASTVMQLDRLMSAELESLNGKLLLVHGQPGTGKTTMLRALAARWRGWCQFDYVLDPELLFQNSNYLLKMGLGDDEDQPDEAGEDGAPIQKARMLILEDCDQLIATASKDSVGLSVSRMLNLTDGILGQGLGLLLAVTTNEPLSRLHRGLLRPGRCMAQIEVGPLTKAEARRFLGGDCPYEGDTTLAALSARRNGLAERSPDRVASVGQYL